MLDLHRIVNQSAFPARSVQTILHALIKSAKIHAQDCVERMLNVASLATRLCVYAVQVSSVIHSHNAEFRKHLLWMFLTHVNRIHVVPMQFAVSKTEQDHVSVLLSTLVIRTRDVDLSALLAQIVHQTELV